MKAVWVAVVLVAPFAAGCFGGSGGDGSPSGFGGAVALALPGDLTMDGAEVIHRNETSVTFRWTGTSPPGVFGLSAEGSPSSAFDVPAGLPLAGRAIVHQTDGAKFGIAVEDAAGDEVCFNDVGTTGTIDATCFVAIQPRDAAERWTVRLDPGPNGAAPSATFEAELTLRLDSRLLDLDEMADASTPPGCDANRPAVVHRAGGIVVDDEEGPAPIACVRHAGIDAWEPSLGITEDGAVFISARTYSNPGGFGAARTMDDGATWELVVPHVEGVDYQRTSLV